MSVHVFFSFSTGLETSLQAPVGTKASIIAHVESVETTLGLKRTRNKPDGDVYWNHWDKAWRQGWPKVPDELLCDTIEEHNEWVRRLYYDVEQWAAKPVEDGEIITPKDAEGFWFGLQLLTVRPERWTRKYYISRMEHLYEVMRGRENEGVVFDAKALTPKQCAAVMLIFSEYFDAFDTRLDVPNGHDYLASSYDGGYEWCEKCGAMTYEDGQACRKRKCPLREEAAA